MPLSVLCSSVFIVVCLVVCEVIKCGMQVGPGIGVVGVGVGVSMEYGVRATTRIHISKSQMSKVG